MTEVNMNDVNKITTPEPKKSKKPIIMHRPPQQQQNKTNDEHHEFDKNIPNELQSGLKTLAMMGLAVTVPATKRNRMMTNLQNSKYTNEYLDKYLCIDNIAMLDDHTKFALVYGINALDCFMFGSNPDDYTTEAIQSNVPPQNEGQTNIK